VLRNLAIVVDDPVPRCARPPPLRPGEADIIIGANTSIATAGRGLVLTRTLTVISDSAKAFADIIDTERSARLELIIVALIVVENVIGGLQLLMH